MRCVCCFCGASSSADFVHSFFVPVTTLASNNQFTVTCAGVGVCVCMCVCVNQMKSKYLACNVTRLKLASSNNNNNPWYKLQKVTNTRSQPMRHRIVHC